MKNRTCSIDGCDTKHNAKGFCAKHYMKQRYHSDIERFRAENKARRSNPEARARAAETTRKWREANPERVVELNRSWRAKNREREREMKRAYREKNRDLIRALNNKRKAALRKVEINDLTGQQWRQIKASWQHRCAYCGVEPPVLTMDHYIAIANGGNHTASNIVPACLPCNAAKGDRPAPPFYTQEAAS